MLTETKMPRQKTKFLFQMSKTEYTILAKIYDLFSLRRTIQDSIHGHCSTEDATATLDLVKLKLSKGLSSTDSHQFKAILGT